MKKIERIIITFLVSFLLFALLFRTLATDVIIYNNDNEVDNNNTVVEKPEKNLQDDENNKTDNEYSKEENETVENSNIKPNESTKSDNKQNSIKQTNKEQQENSKNKENKSNNSYLDNLEVNVEGLSPAFNKYTTQYYLIVDLEVEDIEVKAIAEDNKSEVSVTGNRYLEEGENIIHIVVTAEAGNTTTYVINVTKVDDLERANANLGTLSIKGFNLYPSFKSNIYGYNLTTNELVQELEILAEPENEKATIEITGNENLIEGDNIIKIIVTAGDRSNKKRIQNKCIYFF